MDDNILDQLKKALEDLNKLLDSDAVPKAKEAIPFIINPVIDGLIAILNFIKDALEELKNNLDKVGGLEDLLKTVNSLLEAAEGLATGQEESLKKVKKIVKTLQDLPVEAEIMNLLTLIGGIIDKLDKL